MKLWARVTKARETLAPIVTAYRVAYEDPAEPNAPMRVLVPTAEWMACAVHGGILPPISAYLGMPLLLTLADGSTVACTYVEAQYVRALNDVTAEQVQPHHTLHSAEPIGPMTERQAIEYLIMKDVPHRVWGQRHNRRMMAIITADQLPASREHRNAWKLRDIAA